VCDNEIFSTHARFDDFERTSLVFVTKLPTLERLIGLVETAILISMEAWGAWDWWSGLAALCLGCFERVKCLKLRI
jgi:hypothetical protein